MRNLIKTALAGCLLASTAAVAGLNPASPGLPTANAWGISGTVGLTGIPNNRASALCVECHSANPTTKRSAGKYGWATTIANFQGTHYVGMATNTGGGITWGSLAPRTTGEYLKLDAWYSAPARSKYGVDGGTTAANYASYITDASVIQNATFEAAGTTYNSREMICESCHSVIMNVAGGRNLLNQNGALSATTGKVAGTGTTGDTGFCEGCHGDMTAASTGNTKGNNQPEANNHHVLTLTTHSANRIENAKAVLRLLWTRATAITGADRNMSTAPTYTGQNAEIAFRIRTSTDQWLGGVAGIRAEFNCTDCHAYGHFGRTDTGARILRSGQGTESGKATTGIMRAEDLATKVQPTIWKDDQGYCQGCHIYVK